MSDDERPLKDDEEAIEPPADKVDPQFEDVPREDYADIPDDVGEESKVGKAKKAKRDGD